MRLICIKVEYCIKLLDGSYAVKIAREQIVNSEPASELGKVGGDTCKGRTVIGRITKTEEVTHQAEEKSPAA